MTSQTLRQHCRLVLPVFSQLEQMAKLKAEAEKVAREGGKDGAAMVEGIVESYVPGKRGE